MYGLKNFWAQKGSKRFTINILQGDIMLEKIKKFVKSISHTTWMLVGVGVAAFVILSLSNCHGKAVEVKPAVTEAPAAK